MVKKYRNNLYSFSFWWEKVKAKRIKIVNYVRQAFRLSYYTLNAKRYTLYTNSILTTNMSCILYFSYTYYPHLYAIRSTLGLFTNDYLN